MSLLARYVVLALLGAVVRQAFAQTSNILGLYPVGVVAPTVVFSDNSSTIKLLSVGSALLYWSFVAQQPRH